MSVPSTEGELAQMVAEASGPMAVRGGATRGFGATGEALSVAGLNGISLYEPGALTLVAAAGTPVPDVDAALAGEGQMLAFEPMDHRVLLGSDGTPTIGGMVAANVSGPRRVQAGACRDAMLGVRFVDGTGAVVKNGGRVMKNVTGYDLVKLIAGSFGTLGVVTEVAFKVLPRPEATSSVVIGGLDVARAVAAMASALGSPFDVTGAAHLMEDGGRTWLRVEGFEASVAYRAGALKDRLAAYGALEIVGGAGPWAEIRDARPLSGCAAVWRISVRPGAAPDLCDALKGRGVADLMLDWGGGLIWAGADDAAALHGFVQALAARSGGHATLVKTPQAGLARFQPATGPVARIEAGLRARFDPRGVLNAGLMERAA